MHRLQCLAIPEGAEGGRGRVLLDLRLLLLGPCPLKLDPFPPDQFLVPAGVEPTEHVPLADPDPLVDQVEDQHAGLADAAVGIGQVLELAFDERLPPAGHVAVNNPQPLQIHPRHRDRGDR